MALRTGMSFKEPNRQTHLWANQRKLCSTIQQNSAVCTREVNVALVLNVEISERMCNKVNVYIDSDIEGAF